jgi:hypothetical protein
MMHRCFAALALFSMLIHVMLVPAALEMLRIQAKAAAKQQIKAGIPRTERIRFVVGRDRQPVDGTILTWHHDGEFSVNSMMFDVLAERDSADCTVLETMADMEEAWLTYGLDGRTQDLLRKALSSKQVRRLMQTWQALHPCALTTQHGIPGSAELSFEFIAPCCKELCTQCSLGVDDPPPRVGFNHLI